MPVILGLLALGFLGAFIYFGLGGKRFSGPDIKPLFGQEVLIRPQRWDPVVRTPDILGALKAQGGRASIPKVNSWDPSEMTIELFPRHSRP